MRGVVTGATETVTAAGDGADLAMVPVRQLVIVHAPARPEVRRRVLDDRPVVIGREPGDGLRLPDAEASRRHATVALDPARGAWTITDHDSRNGVFVDGERVHEATLTDGATIRIGGCVLAFVAFDLPAHAPLEPEDEHLLGPSVRMQALRGELALLAPRPLPALLLGESGAGKERAARALHARSGRSGPFVAVNCAAIAPTVAESELFGHVAGAFTGAVARRDGLFVAAHGGTLFLDEIGELPLELQPKLLRALALGEVRAVGASDTRTVDVRVVAATLVDLGAAVAAGKFRGDLFARLAGWTVTVPPLRAHKEDLGLLAAALLAQLGSKRRLSAGAVEALMVHGWPYNVRELEHALAVADARADGAVIRTHHLPPGIGGAVRTRAGRGTDAPEAAPAPLALTVDPSVATPTADDLLTALRYHGGSIALTAAFYGRHRRQVYRWLEAHGLDPDAVRAKD